jgi:uncharacterized protein HemX
MIMSRKKNLDLQIINQENNATKCNISYAKILTWINIFIVTAVLSCCIYVMMENAKLKKEQLQIAKSIQETQKSFPQEGKNEITLLPDNIETILQDLISQINAQKKATKELESLVISDLNPKVNFLLESGTKQQPVVVAQHGDVALIFVINFLRLAELYLTELHDVKMTNNLLTIAEQLLVSSNNTMHIELKDVVEQDKQSITSIQLPDKTTLWLTLNELLMDMDKYSYKKFNIPALPTITSNIDTTVAVVPQEDKQIERTTGWKYALKNTFNELKSLVKIKKNNATQESLASIVNLEENLQRERLRFLLEQAKVASFGENNEHYRTLLITAKNVFLEHFVIEDPLNRQAIAKIEALQEVNLKPMIQTHINSLAKAEALLQSTDGSETQ